MNARINAADVFLASGPLQPVAAANLHAIRDMLEGCGTSNRNYLLVIAIEPLIDAGVDTGPRIVGVAASFGFKSAHAGAILRAAEGGSAARHRWERGTGGVYRLNSAKLAA